MLSLEFLKGPLMNAAAALGKLPGAPTPGTGTGTTAPKPMLGGIFGKAGKLLPQALPAPEMGAPAIPPRLATPNFDPLTNRMPAVKIAEPDRVEDVPIPALPGRTGGARPFDPQTKAEYEYVMKHVPRDEAGAERKLTFGERFKKSLLPALLGTVQGINASPNNPLGGAIGGAGAGFAGGMIDPTSARQYEWSQMFKPEMEAGQQQREVMNAEQQRKEEGLVNLDARRAGIDHTKAQTDALRANSATNQAYRDSQIRLNEARAQALATGKPQLTDEYDPETNQMLKVQVFADGTKQIVGQSGAAQLKREGFQTQTGIASQNNAARKEIAEGRNQTAVKTTQMRQEGATQRTGMTQAGQDRRAGGGAAATPGKTAAKQSATGSKRQAFIDRAVSAGYSTKEATAEANRRGLK